MKYLIRIKYNDVDIEFEILRDRIEEVVEEVNSYTDKIDKYIDEKYGVHIGKIIMRKLLGKY